VTRAYRLLRFLRTLIYRAASPVESRLLSARQRSELPPLWLRRHVGEPAKFASAARDTAALIDRLDLLAPGATVLDIGCGSGAMVSHLLERLGPEGRYVGFDVHGPSIEWCRRRWKEEPRARFHQAEIHSPYATGPARAPLSSYRFPVEDRSVDLVLAKSVFTHLLPEELRHYLGEIDRVLAPEGCALASFFLFDEASGAPPPAFPFPADPHAAVRWRRWGWRHAAVAYSRSRSRELIASAGLAVEIAIDGFWPGAERAIEGQDLLVLRSVSAAGSPSRDSLPGAALRASAGGLGASSGELGRSPTSPAAYAAVRHVDPPLGDG
jgi:SAM-dependent methyltransferase